MIKRRNEMMLFPFSGRFGFFLLCVSIVEKAFNTPVISTTSVFLNLNLVRRKGKIDNAGITRLRKHACIWRRQIELAFYLSTARLIFILVFEVNEEQIVRRIFTISY